MHDFIVAAASFMVGGFFGILAMCLAQANRLSDEEECDA